LSASISPLLTVGLSLEVAQSFCCYYWTAAEQINAIFKKIFSTQKNLLLVLDLRIKKKCF